MRKARWRLTLPLDEARRNDEVISLADSQMLRWIDELNGITDADERAREIKSRIRYLRKHGNGAGTRAEIRRLYSDLDNLQFKPDYMCLIIDREKDYYKACSGFSINGVRYKRLLGTNGGIKNSTIVFVSERLHPELSRRVENDRDPQKPLVTAKLEAYKALTCSASIPVSMPNGVLVVPDAETRFRSDIIYLNDETDGEPIMEERPDEEIVLDASDGYGLMSPALAARWSAELGLDYTASGCNLRAAFTKGMVVAFDFHEFAGQVAKRYFVKDAWGTMVDIRQVELVLTTSMVKLWDSYKSCEDFLSKSVANGYTFAVAKTAPKELESERTTNYQFVQVAEFSDDDIDALISPTMREIDDVLHSDWIKSILFLRGCGITEDNVARMPDDFIKAIMIDRRVMDDPFVQNAIYQLIRNRINEAKIGVLKVHGNYSIVCGDPYLLCQSIFGLECTGLLKAGEIYNRYWADSGAERLACFRAPMSVQNNVRIVHPNGSKNVRYWYRHIQTMTVLNNWDTATMALNGCDFDGDLVMLTDNEVLTTKIQQLPALMCVQRKADKRISTEEDFIRSNIDSFGNDIGQTTNLITSMYDVRAQFTPGSSEYQTLTYRIQCGQLFQQNSIDRAKGIISKPMPRSWHDRHAAVKIEGDDRDLYRRIVADKKPYFMRYVYPELMRKYNTYIKNTDRNAKREFQLSIDQLMSLPYNQLTERQKDFLKYYDMCMPVSMNNCVMNRICRKFEATFDGYIGNRVSHASFDYHFMRGPEQYSKAMFAQIKSLYEEYNGRLASYSIMANMERVADDDAIPTLERINDDFRNACCRACPDEGVLCNIVLDLCYTRKATKQFAWEMCGKQIIRNLLAQHNNKISFPTLDPSGEIAYGGQRFSLREKEIEVFE